MLRLTMTVGDVLVALSMLGSAAAVAVHLGRRLGRIEGWVTEARQRFDRIEDKVDRLVEREV
jgi:hypothetical protein